MDQFWLSDEQFARIAPLLPTDTRGKPRVDDRRVISGIVHVLRRPLGRCTARLRTQEDALQPFCSVGGQGCVVEPVRDAGKRRRAANSGADRLLGREGTSLRLRW
jgi:hypothetical protein